MKFIEADMIMLHTLFSISSFQCQAVILFIDGNYFLRTQWRQKKNF